MEVERAATSRFTYTGSFTIKLLCMGGDVITCHIFHMHNGIS